MRKRAGLYGISVVTVALYQKKSNDYLRQLLDPVLRCFQDKDMKVQQAACDALFNIIKIVKEAILRDKATFLKIFDSVINLIYDYHQEITQWAKKVDDLLKNQVYTALTKSQHFDLEALINHISEKLKATNNQEVMIVMIKWLEVLHSIQNVNILPSVPKFLEKLLINTETKNAANQRSEVAMKSIDLLQMFISDFQLPQARNVKLDKKIINKLLRFLLKDKLTGPAPAGPAKNF
jgi:vacuole morphology and inheritance protein 14